MTNHTSVKPETYVSSAPMILRTWGFLLVQHVSPGKVFPTMSVSLFKSVYQGQDTMVNNISQLVVIPISILSCTHLVFI